MPRVSVCGILWNFGADDLVVPMICNIAFKACCSMLLAGLLYSVWHADQFHGACTYSRVHVYIGGLLSVLFVGLWIDARIGCIASVGAIPDYNRRRGVSKYINANVCLGVLEAGLAVLGSYAVFFHDSCGESVLRRDPDLHTALEAVIIVHWVTLLARLCGLCVTCDCRGSVRKRRRLDPISRDRFRHERWTRRCRYLRCCSRVVHTSGHEVFQEVGLLLAQLFKGPDMLDLTFSDLAAGLTLVRTKQKEQEDMAVQQAVRTHLLESKYDSAGPQRSFSANPGQVHSHNWAMSDQRTEHSVSLDTSSPHDTNALADATHFSNLALSVYGWMLYTYMRPCTGLCRLTGCCFARCISHCGSHPRVTGDSCMCNETAFIRQSGIRDMDVLYANWANDSVCTVAYAVTVDHSRQAVVVSCRGTLSVNDAITDAMAEEQDLRRDPEAKALDLPDGHCSVHKGMWRAAKFIEGELAARGVLAGALGDNPDVAKHIPLLGRLPGGLRLIVTGHSLGAGVATLLCMLLRRKYPHAICWAFSPPGALMSPVLAAEADDWCTSVVLGKDLVPRLSVPALYRLSRQMIFHIGQARVNKHTVLCQWCCCTKRRVSTQLMYPDHILPQSEGAARIREYLEHAELEERFDGHNLVLPGRILHLVKRGTKKRRCCHSCRRCSLCHTKRVYQARWASREDFQEILVSVLMVEDHMPDKVTSVLRDCLYDSLRHKRRGGGLPRDVENGLTHVSRGKAMSTPPLSMLLDSA